MNNRSFSSRLSWRIIGIVSVIFLASFAVIGIATQYVIAHESARQAPLLLVLSLLVVGILGLVIVYFVCRKEIRRMTRPITELSVSAMNMGKGVPASLVMSITRAMLHFVATLDLPLSESVSRINNSVADSNSNDMFVTLFIGRINLKTMHMDYCNAGHNPPVILAPGEAPRFLEVKSNLAAGLMENFPC